MRRRQEVKRRTARARYGSAAPVRSASSGDTPIAAGAAFSRTPAAVRMYLHPEKTPPSSARSAELRSTSILVLRSGCRIPLAFGVRW